MKHPYNAVANSMKSTISRNLNISLLYKASLILIAISCADARQLGFGQRHFKHNWHYQYGETRETARAEREIKFTTRDGLVRYGTISSPLDPENAQGCIVLCHPAAYDKSFMAPYVDLLFENFHCLRFDFRRHGDAARQQYTTMGKDEAYDVEAAALCIRKEIDNNSLPLYGFGISMGGAALLEAEARFSLFNGLIIQSTFDSLGSQIKRFSLFFQTFPFLIFRQPTKWYAHKNHRWRLCKVKPYRRIRSISVPIFLIHAQNDSFVSFRSFGQLCKNGKSIIRTWSPAEGRHTEILQHNPEEYRKQIQEFFAQLSAIRSSQEMLHCSARNHANS